MSSNPSLIATHPTTNATVSASAGCGKTWLLVTRIIRLLLAGAEPGSILALTFTRKAAAEMSIRLDERLYDIAISDDAELLKELTDIGAKTDADTCLIARCLYEKNLHALNPVRVLTFHAFCQDILSRFPMEADIPPGFELREDTSLIEQQTWDSLFTLATRYPNGTLAEDLDQLMRTCNGPANTRTALSSFLQQRNDWWAYTQHQSDPVDYASRRLKDQLNVDDSTQPLTAFFHTITLDTLIEFSTLLGKHPTKTNLKLANDLAQLLAEKPETESFFQRLQPFFLTRTQQPLANRKHTTAQQKSMGADNENRFLSLHDHICQHLLDAIDLQKRCVTLKINQCWYRAGNEYIDMYQMLKRELRVLDFSDLEWKCYQLLNSSENALWIQYKIDQRIDHFLVDEFQDTNPTQWYLLKPLLEEIAANPNERWRSVFLVGDPKQSIYSFRRANPKLQTEATLWLERELDSQCAPLDSSRRSSPAIIDAVNQIFTQEELKLNFSDFAVHDTHLKNLPGQVTVLQLCTDEKDEDSALPTTLRNPLLQPRTVKISTSRRDEANLIAQKINEMLSSALQITLDGEQRAVDYGDIMILMRNRTHSDIYESVLQQHGIPFLSNQRGSFLSNLEVNDMERLLDTLITPFDNLAIAQILKSPIFAASDDELILLAQADSNQSWYQRLSIVTSEAPHAKSLVRAEELLTRWRLLADTIPVHDLLDRIFCEADILQRYSAAVPDLKKAQVKANLQQFLELSLEFNSGRYPSLSRFLDHLRNFRKQTAQAPDDAVITTESSCVRLMTIHASKGLESPVVFLADSNNTASNKDAYNAMVYWPASHEKPTHFQLLTDKASTDNITVKVQQQKAVAQTQEDLNLLYVATTRSRQYLIISGTESRTKNKKAWYSLITSAMQTLATETEDGSLVYSVGQYGSTINNPEIKVTTPSLALDQRLTSPLATIKLKNRIISPSHLGETQTHYSVNTHATGRERGIITHRAIELILQNRTKTCDELCQLLINETNTGDFKELQTWVTEAYEITHNEQFKDFFQPPDFYQSYSELPLLFKTNNQSVYGIVDRLIIQEEDILLIDYKSHHSDEPEKLDELAETFSEQLRLYKLGVQEIWPQHVIKTGILFTHHEKMVWLDI